MQNSKVTFSNTRARFQRLSDAKLFNGWVNTLTPKGIILAIPEPISAGPGENFRFEVYGKGAIAVFEARLEIVSGNLAAFVLISPIRAMPSSEEMRLRAADYEIQLFFAPPALAETGISEVDRMAEAAPETPLAEGVVADVSTRGIGFVSERPISKGERVRFVLESMYGRCEGIAEARYCKPEGISFRIGLQIEEMDRLNRGLFERLIEKSVA